MAPKFVAIETEITYKTWVKMSAVLILHKSKRKKEKGRKGQQYSRIPIVNVAPKFSNLSRSILSSDTNTKVAVKALDPKYATNNENKWRLL